MFINNVITFISKYEYTYVYIPVIYVCMYIHIHRYIHMCVCIYVNTYICQYHGIYILDHDIKCGSLLWIPVRKRIEKNWPT